MRIRSLLLAATLGCSVITPGIALAQPSAVPALLEQASYWQGKGRPDRANQAYRRVLAIDPKNTTARKGLARQPAPPPAPAPAPVAAAKKRTVVATAPQPAPAALVQRPAPSRPVVVDRGGDARAAGFRSLEGGDLDSAGRRFEQALSINRNDADAAGGLGIVRLRERRFVEARDLLERASRRGSSAKWLEALSSARFYAGMEQAEAATNGGRLDEAQRIAEGLVASNFGDKSAAYDLLGGIYEQQGRYAGAANIYAQAGQQTGQRGGAASGGSVQGRALRAQALAAAASGNAMQAEQLFQQGLLADRDDPWIRYEFARFLERQGRRSQADAVVESLRSSADPEAIYAAALLRSQTGRSTEAGALLDRIPQARMTPEMQRLAMNIKVDAAIARAKAIAGQGQRAQAATALRQIANTPGLSVASRGALADALYESGDVMGASQVAQQALSEPAGDAASYESIVRVLAKTGQDAFAMSAVQRAGEAAAGSPEGQQTVARMNGILAASQADRLRESGQFAQAFDLLQSQWSASPNNIDVLSALGRLYQSGGMYPQAAQTFRLILNQAPSDKAALVGLIDAASSVGDFDLARDATQRAIALSPEDYSVYMAASRMAKARGDERDAVRYLKRARELYLGHGSVAGGFGGGNPFAAMPSGAGANPFAGMQPQQPVNPFAFGSNPQSVPQPMPPRGNAGQGFQAQGYSQAVPAQAYPGPAGGMAMPVSYAAPGYPAPGGTAMASNSYAAPGAYGAPTASQNSDPVLQSIENDMKGLVADTAPRVDVKAGARQRSGETGLSELKELTADAKISTGLGGGRVFAKAGAVVLDAGKPEGSGLARFARNGTPEARAIWLQQPSSLATADPQHASGVALSAGYESDIVSADIGTTPLGFEKTKLAGSVAVTPRLSRYFSGRAWAERRPVTDSVVSYAGTEVPVSGEFWGAVMKTGGGVSLSYDRDGNGVYADASYHHYDGTNVRDNESMQINAGGYMKVYQDRRSTLTLGINANYQHYDENQNFFTFGHGGYFSPQSFLSVSFPVRYAMRGDKLDIDASLVPGYQSYDQDESLLYPTDAAAQTLLFAYKRRNNDVRASYDSESKTGFGLSAGGSAYYQVAEGTRIGGELNLNTFGAYNEFKSVLGIRQQIGGAN